VTITDLFSALKAIHYPKSDADMQPTSLARSRISYDELLASQVSLAIRRTTQQASLVHVIDIDNDHDNDNVSTNTDSLVQQCIQALPYTLTKCQTDVLDTINTDMSSGYRMIRLLQGELYIPLLLLL
jgi:ATP-dependent DNA helicase RecG